MKKATLIHLFLLFNVCLSGQNQAYQTLDTDQLIERAFQLNEQLETDSSQLISTYVLSERSLNGIQRARLRSIEALQTLKRGDVPNALFDLKKALKTLEQNRKPNALYKAHVLHGLGKAYLEIQNSEQSKAHYNRAIDQYLEAGEVFKAEGLASEYGMNMMVRGNYLESLSYLTRSMELVVSQDTTKTETQQFLPQLFMNLALAQNRLGQKELAIAYAKQAIHYGHRHRHRNIPSYYATLGAICRGMEDYDTALKAYKKALIIAKNRDMPKSIRMALSNIANLFSIQGDLDSAIHYLRNGDRIGEVSDFHLQNFNVDLARYYKTANQPDSAILFAQRAITYAKSISNYRILRDSYALLSDLDYEKGQTERALEYQRQYKIASDSILVQANAREYAELNLKLQTMDKEYELAQLNAAMASQRQLNTYLFMLIGVTALALVFILKYWLSERRRKNLEINNIMVSKELAESDLKNSQQELADSAVRILAQQQFLEELETTVKQSAKGDQSIDAGTARQIDKAIRLNKATANDWDTFITSFGSANSDFFNKLKATYPNLTSGELKHCALLKMNTSIKQAAQLLGVDQKSVTQARYRLKKKMQLSQDESIHEAVYRF